MIEAQILEPTPTVRSVIGPTIAIYGGTYFDFLNPEGSQFSIFDIAHALSNVCRFSGHCYRSYSVAQHSVHVADNLSPEHAYAGLMHDAAEAFIGDVSKPLKILLPDYKRIEQRVEAAVFSRFKVPNPLPPEVKEMDIILLATEQRDLMRNDDVWDFTRGRKPLGMRIEPWPSEVAYKTFLARYSELRNA